MVLFGLYGAVMNIILLLVVAFYTLVERKVIASIQRRRGPNVVGIWGIRQPIADAVKLIAKEVVIPTKANKLIYLMAPLRAITASIINWSIRPVNFYAVENYTNLGVSGLRWFCVSSFGVYAIVLSGWSSNSKYAFRGSRRSSAQMISYEVFFSMVLLTIIVLSGSANLRDIVIQQGSIWFLIPCVSISIIFFIAAIAETNRTPFDLPEAEAEIVAGYNIEYSSMAFAIFFRAEYGNMFAISFMTSTFFRGGWALPVLPNSRSIAIKSVIIAVLFVVVRANFPRYRYDQRMGIGWKRFIPRTFALFIGVVARVGMYSDNVWVALDIKIKWDRW